MSQQRLSPQVLFLLDKLKTLKKEYDCEFLKLANLHNLNIGYMSLEKVFLSLTEYPRNDVDIVMNDYIAKYTKFRKEHSQVKSIFNNKKFIKSLVNKIEKEICPKIKVILDLVDIIYNKINFYIKLNGDSVVAVRHIKHGFIYRYIFKESGNIIYFNISNNTKYFHTLMYCNYDVRLFKFMTKYEKNLLNSLNVRKYNKYRKELQKKYSLYNKEYETLLIEEKNKLIHELKINNII